MGTRHRSFRTPFTAGLLLIGCGLILAGCQIPGVPADVDAPHASLTAIRRPVGPDDLPDRLAGRWRISLCVSDDNGHAWIRFENADSGDVRSVGRYHLLVGGWFDRGKRRWNYLPTFRTGLHMDREQRREPDLVDGSEMLRTAWVEDPPLFVGGDPRGHALVRNNCATYARDAWYFYTGEYWPLPAVHTPKSLREAVNRGVVGSVSGGSHALLERPSELSAAPGSLNCPRRSVPAASPERPDAVTIAFGE